ncbi:hypothetical protein EON77_22150, partial [bacterium]
MNYMLLIYHEEPPLAVTNEKPSGCDGLAERLMDSGHYVASGILQPTLTSTSLRVRQGKRLVTDGPFAETREQLAGYLLFEAENLDEALRIAAEHPVAQTGTVEVRPVQFSYDWPTPQTPERPMTPSATPFVISRTFDAPRDLVWRAWTEADLFAEWWGNRGFTVELAEFDPRSGGQTRYAMRTPSGDAMHGKFVYREVSAPDHLVFVSGFADADGEFAPAPFEGPWPLRIETTVTFESVDE